MSSAIGLVPALSAVAASAIGSTLLLRAGLREGRGEILLARRLARTGGFFLAAGCAGQLLSIPFISVRPLLGGFAAAAAIAAGFAGLLAGLSGKPRPSGAVAFLLWTGSVLFGLGAAGIVCGCRC